MKRIRKIGLVALAALALSAVGGVGSASAALPGFVADEYPVGFTGTGPSQHVLGFAAGNIGCDPPIFEVGTKGPAAPLTTENVVTSQCSNGRPGGTTTLKANGCQFSYHPGAETSKGVFGGTISIGPAGCGPMTVKPSFCPITIGAQSGLAATYENVGSGSSASVNITIDADNLTYTQSNIETGCQAGTFKGGTWNGTWNVSGEDNSQELNGIRVALVPQVGLFLAGESFQAESYPMSIFGQQDAGDKLVFMPNGAKGPTLTCDTAQFDSALSGSTKALMVDAQYTGCSFKLLFTFPVAVSMNSCHYVLDGLNASPPYTGSFGIACDNAGDAIKYDVLKGGCVISVAPQSGLKGVGLTNIGSGSERGLSVDAELGGIAYTESGPGCAKNPGAGSNGLLSGGLTLEGYVVGFNT